MTCTVVSVMPVHVDQPRPLVADGARTRAPGSAGRAPRRRRSPGAGPAPAPAASSARDELPEGRGGLVEHRHALAARAARETRPASGSPSAGTTTSRPPWSRAPQISQTEKSKAYEWKQGPDVRRAEAEPRRRWRRSSRATLPWLTSDALGPAGRARGVDHVGQGSGATGDVEVGRALGRQRAASSSSTSRRPAVGRAAGRQAPLRDQHRARRPPA